MEINQKPILRLNMKEILSFYSEVIFIDLITVINTCFLKSKNSKHSRESFKTYQMLEEQNSYSRDAFSVFFHSFINNYHQIKSKY